MPSAEGREILEITFSQIFQDEPTWYLKSQYEVH